MEKILDLQRRFAPLVGAGVCLLVGLAELINRLWVAHVFWKSGLLKLQSWSSTLYLFEYEYAVPLLSPELAAYLGTATELAVPVFLALGLGGRVAAGVLFVFNFIAAISYPGLNEVGIMAHQVWGVMLLIAAVRGPGVLSLDAAIGWLLRRSGYGKLGAAPGLPSH